METNKEERPLKMVPLWVLILAVTLTCLIFGLTLFWIFGVSEDAGWFGDQFGALNTLFSGLAFAGVIYAIFQQRQDLNNQQNEIALQRAELKLSRKEFVMNRSVTTTYKQIELLSNQLKGITFRGQSLVGGFYDMNLTSMVRKTRSLVNKAYRERDLSEGVRKIIYDDLWSGNATKFEEYLQSLIKSFAIINEIIKEPELDDQDKRLILKSFINNLDPVTPNFLQLSLDIILMTEETKEDYVLVDPNFREDIGVAIYLIEMHSDA